MGRTGGADGADKAGGVDLPAAEGWATAADYAALGVTRSADAAAIRGAYKARALDAHPDRAGGSEGAFAALAASYERVLHTCTELGPQAEALWTGCVTEGPLKGFGVEVLGVKDVAYRVRVASLPAGAEDFAAAIEVQVGDERFVKRAMVSRDEQVGADVRKLSVNSYAMPTVRAAARERERAQHRRIGGVDAVAASLQRVEFAYKNSGSAPASVLQEPRDGAPPARVHGCPEQVAPGATVAMFGTRCGWGKLSAQRWVALAQDVAPERGERPAPELPGQYDAEADEIDALAERMAEQRDAEDRKQAQAWLAEARARDEARRAAARDGVSPECAKAFMPGGLPSFFAGPVRAECCDAVGARAFFVAVDDDVLADATLRALTSACAELCERASENARPSTEELARMSAKEIEIMEDQLPKVSWKGMSDFPFNDPQQFKWFEEYLYDVALPACFEGAVGPHGGFDANARERAWEAARQPPVAAGVMGLLRGRVPPGDRGLSAPERERFEAILESLERICAVDAYGNVVCPFAREFAAGDFEFEAFLPRERGGPAAADARNCVVAARRVTEWRGLKLPHLVPQEDLLCGVSLLKLRNAAMSGARPSVHPNGILSVVNVVELLVGYVPVGDPSELRVREELPDPLMGFSSVAEAAAFLEELHELAEPEGGPPGTSVELGVRPRKGLRSHFSDGHPRAAYDHETFCVLCRGEQLWCMPPLSMQDAMQSYAHGDLEALDPLRKMVPRLCANCEYLSVRWHGPALGMGGRARDLAAMRAKDAEREDRKRLRESRRDVFQRAASRAGHGHRFGEAAAEAHDMVADLRARGRHEEANDLQAELAYETDDDDAEGEILDVY